MVINILMAFAAMEILIMRLYRIAHHEEGEQVKV